MGQTNLLGAYLQARRGQVSPEQAGLDVRGVRRVPGLRREEVAMLAGISADYYLRLERGRDRHPSIQVLEAIARVLQLDEDHLAHLLTLVADPPRLRARRSPQQAPPPGASKLLGTLTHPAFIEDRYFAVLAANRMASALSPALRAGGNQLRDLFLDPAERALHLQWEQVTECFVANLRQAIGTDLDDPRYIALIGELSLGSPRFGQLWARHDVRRQKGTPLLLDHPRVGQLTLNRERLAINGADEMMLVIYHPDAGSSDADKLALLSSMVVPTDPDATTVATAPDGHDRDRQRW